MKKASMVAVLAVWLPMSLGLGWLAGWEAIIQDRTGLLGNAIAWFPMFVAVLVVDVARMVRR